MTCAGCGLPLEDDQDFEGLCVACWVDGNEDPSKDTTTGCGQTDVSLEKSGRESPNLTEPLPTCSGKTQPQASKHIPTPASDATRQAALDRLTPAQRHGLAFWDSALNAMLDASEPEPRDDAKRVQ